MEIVYLALLIVLGLVVGSFIGALSYRLPRGIGISSGRSLCDACGKKVSWYDNVPLFSFLVLRGKCRDCVKEISLRYPAIELSTALVFVLLGLDFPKLLVASLLIVIFVVDLEQQIIPDSLVFLLLVVSLAIHLFAYSPNLFLNLFSGLAASIFFLFLYFITKGRGMGLGDVKLAIPLGVFLGQKTLDWLFLTFIIGGIVALFLILLGKAHLKQKIAFAPFMIIGFLVIMLFGEMIKIL